MSSIKILGGKKLLIYCASKLFDYHYKMKD